MAITYKQVRVIGHIAAVLALASFVRSLLIYGEDTSFERTFVLMVLLFGWFIVFPAMLAFSGIMPQSNIWSRANYAITMFTCRKLFPPIIIAAFLWITVTPWMRDSRETKLWEGFSAVSRALNK